MESKIRRIENHTFGFDVPKRGLGTTSRPVLRMGQAPLRKVIRDVAKQNKLCCRGSRHALPRPLGCTQHPPPRHGAGARAARQLPGGRGPHGLPPPPRRGGGVGRLDRVHPGAAPQPRSPPRPDGEAAAPARESPPSGWRSSVTPAAPWRVRSVSVRRQSTRPLPAAGIRAGSGSGS